jgi:hypothetical protein
MVAICIMWPEIEVVESGGFEGGRGSVAREKGAAFHS